MIGAPPSSLAIKSVSLVIITSGLLLASSTKRHDDVTNKPPVSLKVSTSIVESADITHLALPAASQWSPVVAPSYAEAAARQQRSTAATQSSKPFQPMEAQIANNNAAIIDNLRFSSAVNAAAVPKQNINSPMQQQHQQQQNFNYQVPAFTANQPQQSRPQGGKIMEVPDYRRSVSTTWSVAPSTVALKNQPQQQSHQTGEELNGRQSKVPPEIEGRSWGDFGNLLQTTAPKQKCSKRSLARALVDAKNLLAGGFTAIERSATPGNLMFGSSLIAAAIPLLAFLLPDNSMTRNLGLNFGKMGLARGVETAMGWVDRSIEHLPSFPRLHPQECVKRSICEAHNDPNKYGAIGFTLRLMFPASELSVTDRMDDMDYKVVNKYRHAAGYGLSHRVDVNNNATGVGGSISGSSSVCKEKYEDCLVSLLDIAQNLLDMFIK